MGRILAVIIAVIASFVLAETLTCNDCTYALDSYCLSNSEVVCSTNTSSCFTASTSFDVIKSVSFSTQGCLENNLCNVTTNATIYGVAYTTKVECCSTDKCNPVKLNGAPSNKMAFSAVIGVAVLASMWGSIL